MLVNTENDIFLVVNKLLTNSGFSGCFKCLTSLHAKFNSKKFVKLNMEKSAVKKRANHSLEEFALLLASIQFVKL
jgi:hypothetical protein